MSKGRDKPVLQLVTTGHVDHGKSTAFGHLLVLLDQVDTRAMNEEDGDRKYLALLAQHKEEREIGRTMALDWVNFETSKLFISLLDAPGHRDFVKSMISGAAQADAAILFISAKKGELEAGVTKGVAKSGVKGGQTLEHLWLCRVLGISQFLVAVSKMDEANWSQETYDQVKANIIDQMKKWGIDPTTVPVIPISGWTGDNLVNPSEQMKWYDGPTLIEAIDKLEPPDRTKLENYPLRIPIFNVYKVRGVGTVPIGVVEAGILRPKDIIRIEPLGKEAEVKTIEMYRKPIEIAKPGDGIGFVLKGISKDELKSGHVACPVDQPVPVVTPTGYFIARIMLSEQASGRGFVRTVNVGMTPLVNVHTAEVPCRFVELLEKLDSRTGESIEKSPAYLQPGDVALVKMTPVKHVAMETFAKIPQLGRFAMRSAGRTIGAGIVTEIVPKT